MPTKRNRTTTVETGLPSTYWADAVKVLLSRRGYSLMAEYAALAAAPWITQPGRLYDPMEVLHVYENSMASLVSSANTEDENNRFWDGRHLGANEGAHYEPYVRTTYLDWRFIMNNIDRWEDKAEQDTREIFEF